MNRVLQITIAFLICTGAAWGQTYGKIGDSCTTANANYPMGDNDRSLLAQHAASGHTHVYLASAGDTVTMFKLWSDNNDSISFGLYEFDAVGDTPTVRAFVDSGLVTTASEWDSVSTKFGLTAGKRYVAALSNVGSTNINLKTESATNTDTLWGQGTPTEWPATYNSTNVEITERAQYCMFFRVAQYGAPASPLNIAPTAFGAVKLAPPQ